MDTPLRIKAITVTGFATILIATTVIVGWLLNVQTIETVIDGFISMKFNTALCFIFLGASLLAHRCKGQYNALLISLLSIFVFIIAALSLAEYLYGQNFGIDELFVTDKASVTKGNPFPGRMATNSTFCFILISLSFLGFTSQKSTIHSVSQYLLHLVTVIAGVSVIGYLYGLPLFYDPANVNTMAIHTALLFFFLSAVATLLYPSLGVTSLFTGHLVGNQMARRLLLIIVSLIVFLGLLKTQTVHYKSLTFEVVVSLLSIVFLVTGLIIIWHTALWLNKNDLKRYEVEEEVRTINENLEVIVQERSAELRELLEKFQESELRFRTAFEYSAIGMGLVSTDFKWLRVNKRLCQLLGYTPEELLTLTVADVTHPDDRDSSRLFFEDALARAQADEPLALEKRYVTKNGTMVWVSVNFTIINDKQGKPLYLISQYVDITARKNAEAIQKRITENEERLRALFDNVEGAACLMDKHLRLILYNNIFVDVHRSLTGKDPVIGDEAYKYFEAGEKRKRYEILDKVLKGQKETLEAEIQRNGKYSYYRTSFTPVIIDGEVTAVSSYSIDLTSRVEAENKVRKADARFKAIVQGVFVGIKLTGASGNIIYRSPSMIGITGWADEEMNHLYLQHTHPDDLEMVAEAYRTALINPGRFVNIINRYKHKNGHYIWIESQICNRLSDPDLEAIIVIIRDITERKIIEDKLKQSEEKYHSLIEFASDAIYLIDFNGKITDVNKSLCNKTGFEKQELLEMNITDLIDPKQLETDPINYNLVHAKGSFIRERRMVNKNGAVIDFELSVKKFSEDRILVIARDISERKRMEAELRKAELTFRTLAEKSMVGVYIARGEQLIYVNPRFAEIFGYQQHELLNLPNSVLEVLYSKEDISRIRNYIEERRSGKKETANYEVTGKKKDGTFNRIEVYGTSVMLDGVPTIVGTILDITERKRSEQILIQSEANLKTIMDTTEIAYVLMNKNLDVVAFNKMMLKFSNMQLNIFPDKNDRFFDYFPREKYTDILLEDAASFRKERIAEFLSNANLVLAGQTISYEVSYPQPGGSLCWYSIRLLPITDDRKDILGLMMEIADITKRKNDEERLTTANQQIKNQLESIKEMAWKQSHLIRGPVANIKGLFALLDDDPSDGELLEYIRSQVERLDQVIIDMANDAAVFDLY